MKRKFIFILTCFSLFVLRGYAQDTGQDTSEVGITEHLSQTIPLDLKFVNDKFDTVTLKELVNKPTIFSFVYFDCPGLCSPLLEGVGSAIEKTELELGKDYQVITVSFNFRDTPDKAKKKKDKFTKKYAKGKGDGWIFLTTDSLTIFNITDAFGYRIKAQGLDFIHPSAIVAVSPEGMITRYLYGITFLPFDVKMAIIEAGKGIARPTIQKVLLFCFGYDPVGKRYALDVTKTAGTVIIFFAVVFLIVLLVKSRKKKTKIAHNE